MRYVSTRGGGPSLGFSDAVAAGLAPDGGLFVPQSLPDLSGELSGMKGLSYAELCIRFFSHFATDIPAPELAELIRASYARFDRPEVAPLRRLSPNLHVLELFHGPTLAFKDVALQFLGNLYARQCRLRAETINVLGATSGDTGAAAIHGLMGKPGVAIFILYPDGRVSPLQERQMACTGAPNVHSLAVSGSFDDAQAVLKEIFGDATFKARHRLSAVNSINIARVLAQCVYYLSAWLRLPEDQQSKAEFVVPTGNFGNVLAGWMLKQMGVPIHGFRVATNQNDILHRFFTTGEYRVGEVHPSLAPSMDIQVASNFERFIYYSLGGDGGQVRGAMDSIKSKGLWSLPGFKPGVFTSSKCTDAEITGIIRDVHREHGYIVDPHTACGFKDLDAGKPSVVLATASPAKFPEAIMAAIGIEPTDPTLDALKSRPLVRHKIVADAAAIRAFIDSRAV
ncbi:MAG TPA: threonine synthase [Opitutaceae bacterium]|jgi:threonine synthase|nr:threonine synthase [Opitutaceae bacterium]